MDHEALRQAHLAAMGGQEQFKTLREQILKANDEIDEAIVPPDISMNVVASLYPRRTFCAIRQLRARALSQQSAVFAGRDIWRRCRPRYAAFGAREVASSGSSLLIVMHIGDPI
jgi:hypothetical protein